VIVAVVLQCVATAAALAIDTDVAVQAVDYDTLRERLLADGQVLQLSDQEEWIQRN